MDSLLRIGPDSTGLWLLIDGDRISGMGRGEAPETGRALPCDGAVLEPGQVNAHTHLYSGLASLGMPAPVPPPENFPQILERVWWRLDRALDEDTLRAAARLYCAEALLYGTTALFDHHESPSFVDGSLDVLADAAQELGIRALIGYGATERNGGRAEAARGLAECRRFSEANRRPLVRGAVALHAPFTVTDETIRDAGALARELGLVVHVHVAEDRVDVERAVSLGYADPLDRLVALGGLPEGSILAHGVHLAAPAIARAEALGHWLVQNPRSNRGNGVGYASQLQVSRRVALGTDGYPADMLAEARALDAEARAHGDDLEAAALRPAASRRMAEELLGIQMALEVGADADFVARRPDGAAVHVVVAGRVVVQEGVLVTADIETTRAQAAREADRLWATMQELSPP
jgi:cytosine/adenosine deaminase-related metal-dependent hydrolase